jgi:tetratricopeptide (TPR) repeat protein
MLVDDLVRAEFSRSKAHARELLAELSKRVAEPAEPAQIAELLLDAKDPAELLEAGALDDVPTPIQLEVLLQLAWLYAEREDDERTLTAATRALALEPADERALAIAEPLLLENQAFAELANHYAEAATAAGTEQRAKQLLERAMHMLEDAPAAAPALLALTEHLSQLHRLREKDDSLLAVLKHGGADASAALLKLGERWLSEGRARDGVDALPQDLSVFRSDATLDLLERLFDQAEELDRLARVLRTRADAAATPVARGRGLEKLATFLHERRADHVSAAGALLAAATAFTQAGESDDAERAYERLLDILPEHVNAAAQLVMLRAKSGNFSGVVEAFSVVLRAEGDAKPAAELLLGIAADAERACAADEMAELSESVQWRLSAEQRELSDELMRTSARLFAAQARYDEAAEPFRRLIADRGAERDLRAFQTLIDESPDRDWRQTQQRWLFEWQGHHSADRPSVLLEWARFEETEGGDPGAAADVLWRAAELSPERGEIWEELLRLRLAAGDGAASLAAAEELRRLGRELPHPLLEALLEHAPGARWLVDRVKLGLSAEARWQELFELYDRAIDAAPAEERRAWLEEAAIAARDVAQDRERRALLARGARAGAHRCARGSGVGAPLRAAGAKTGADRAPHAADRQLRTGAAPRDSGTHHRERARAGRARHRAGDGQPRRGERDFALGAGVRSQRGFMA